MLWSVTLKVPPWWPMKSWKNFAIRIQIDCWKMYFQSKKHRKYTLLWSAFLVDNVLREELRQLQWNVSYWNVKDGRLSFETQLKIGFSSLDNCSKKCLKIPVLVKVEYIFWMYLLIGKSFAQESWPTNGYNFEQYFRKYFAWFLGLAPTSKPL